MHDAADPGLLLPASLSAWGEGAFRQTFERECRTLNPDLLPLQQGMAYGSRVVSDDWSLIYLGATADSTQICVKAGVFFGSVIAGCSCADDPTPLDVGNEYCEVVFSIDRRSGRAEVALYAE